MQGRDWPSGGEGMQTYLFITKPDYDVAAIRSGQDGWWSCSKTTRAGDRIFVYVTGGGGILREWRAVSDAKRDKKWTYTCDVAWVRRINPAIQLHQLLELIPRNLWAPPHLHFKGYSSIRIPEEVEAILDIASPPQGIPPPRTNRPVVHPPPRKLRRSPNTKRVGRRTGFGGRS